LRQGLPGINIAKVTPFLEINKTIPFVFI